MNSSKRKIRILSIDGGGIRGVIPAVVMEYVEEKLIELSGNPDARIADYFDLFVGTSTGGILSCFYLTPDEGGKRPKYRAAQATEFYSLQGYSIFNASKRSNWGGLRQTNASYSMHHCCPKRFSLSKTVFDYQQDSVVKMAL
jgi:patatin-like phospholipase/acyl hydrolase